MSRFPRPVSIPEMKPVSEKYEHFIAIVIYPCRVQKLTGKGFSVKPPQIIHTVGKDKRILPFPD